jgi:DNA-directed RNA polymerase subunit H (RpoH/RPB5)
MTSELTNDITLARNTLLEQLDSLGYDVNTQQHISKEDVLTMIDAKNIDMHLAHSSESKEVYVIFHVWNKTTRPQNVSELVDFLYRSDNPLSEECTLLIIFSEKNDGLNVYLEQLWDLEGIYVVIQGLQNLTVNHLKHTLVPKHIILSEEEKNNVLTKYNSTIKMMPEIDRNDAIARIILLRPGQMVKIERPSKLAIIDITYRVCV